MFYPILKNIMFKLDPERAHAITLSGLQRLESSGLLSLLAAKTPESPVELMGLTFRNRVGIAAGLDKNAVCIDALSALGAGHVEIGTVTPRPQEGNAKPRVFRLPEAQALINRMGFPNEGMDAVLPRLMVRSHRAICGANIGKNASTPLEQATQDYLSCLRVLAPQADYITINVSSPNTLGLRNLQATDYLRPMLRSLLEERAHLTTQLNRKVPLLVKIAPDLKDDELYEMADLFLELGIDGVIATNTTLSRPDGLGPLSTQAGGLSGGPVHRLSLAMVNKLRQRLGHDFPIIGVGGISSADDALSMRQAGADLVQIYTGLIYRGPSLIKEVAEALS